MQKEALIEGIPQICALIHRKISPLLWNEDLDYWCKKRNFLYSNPPENINFDEIVNELKEAMNRYKSMPDKE